MRQLALAALALVACDLDLSQSTSPLTADHAVIASLSDAVGGHPQAPLVVGPDGMLWGTAWQRGPNALSEGGACSSTASWDTDAQERQCPGSVFRLWPDGSGLEVVHAFTTLDAGNRNDDGYQPVAGLTVGNDGLVYGTTTKGGRPAAAAATTGGMGVMFRIDPASLAFDVVHTCGAAPRAQDCKFLYGGFVVDAGGSLVTSSKSGLAFTNQAGGFVRLDPATLTLTTIHAFAPVNYAATPDINADGGNPTSTPAIDSDGRLHSLQGGWGPMGGGTIVSVGTIATVDRAFSPLGDPTINRDNTALQSLTVASDGRLYGTRAYAGDNGTGEIFRLDANGYEPLLSFAPAIGSSSPRFANTTGAVPLGTMLEVDGALIGTTFYGGAQGVGCVFRFDPATLEIELLHSFTGGAGGARPVAGVIVGPDGALYGTTRVGGAPGPGTIYRLSIGGL